jgi:CRISPR-associated endonuclease/helicase Cas3
MRTAVQTGARPEDRRLEADLIFTTIDQTLSNFLCIPYALSNRQANLNAGAVISSYLIFDELHLFDPSAAFPTTLQMLHMLRGVTPFVLMTATLSETMIDTLCNWLGAEKVVVSSDELAEIPSQQGKVRRFHVIEAQLTPDPVLAYHQQRSLAVCNTVDRAQQLYQGLVAQGCRPVPFNHSELERLYQALGSAHEPPQRQRLLEEGIQRLYKLIREYRNWDQVTWVLLLHARFIRSHRDFKEAFVRKEFGSPEKHRRQVPNLILVATQVVEVGLDITCQALHTEIAPASSVLQRAGRCARFIGESGDVFIYQVPTDDKGEPRYQPYHTGGQQALCEASWEAFADPRRNGHALNFAAEQEVIREVHAEHDARLLERLRAGRYDRRQRMYQAIAEQDRGLARDLIREVDSRAVIVHPNPRQIEDPWAYEPFGLHRGTLFGAFRELEELARTQGYDGWIMMVPRELVSLEQDSRRRPEYEWLEVRDKDDLLGAPLVAVHPQFAAYDAVIGFRLGEGNRFISPCVGHERVRQERGKYCYQRESYAHHVSGLYRAYRGLLVDEIRYAAARLERAFGLPKGAVDQAIRLSILLHDLGKLTIEWQGWAHRWQEAIGHPVPDGEMLAHTDYDPTDPKHEAAERRLKGRRPPHAVEGARAAAELVSQVWDTRTPAGELLLRAVLTAIARHHATGAASYHDYQLHRQAPRSLTEAMAIMRTHWSFEFGSLLRPERQGDLRELLIEHEKDQQAILYFLLARALRLADQRSQK